MLFRTRRNGQWFISGNLDDFKPDESIDCFIRGIWQVWS